MDTMMKRAGCWAAGAALMLAVSGVHAQTSLLTEADRQQLGAWLGDSSVQFNSLFTKQAGSTAQDFHAAADGMGRTVMLVEATNKAGETFLLGGYNPQSWSSTDGYHMTGADGERTAFLFNLTSGRLHRQMLNGVGTEMIGAYQTLNDPDSGPTFGWGHDFQMSADLTTGYSLLYSYADGDLSNLNRSLADGTEFTGLDDLRYGRMEIYTLSPAPEPEQFILLAAGLAVLVIARRRQR